MQWTGKHVCVVGLGKSNRALIRYLTRKGVFVTACDQKEAHELGEGIGELQQLGVDLHLGPSYLEALNGVDGVFLTPGMRKDLPEIQKARAAGTPITSETNLFFEECRAPIVGITGSSGKTTTTTLIGQVCEASGLKVYVGGNIGTPLIELVDDIPPNAVVVLELSSFQLELARMSPRVAVITNVTPNHLDVHESMSAYVEAKSRIFRYQTREDLLVLNKDNSITRAMAAEADARVMWFSREREVPSGAFVSDGRIVIAQETRSGRSLTDVCAVDELRLIGAHNVENVLAACTVGFALGATAGTLRDVVTTFTGVAHRLELVREAGGVGFYNDSIATSPSRALAGIRAFDAPVHLIAGGYDKKLPFDEFAEEVCRRCAGLYLIGETAPQIACAVRSAAEKVKRSPRVHFCATLEEATRSAYEAARPGEVVLLSPACASYDMFPNFEVRGERFRKAVHAVTERDVPQASTIGRSP